MTSIPRIPSAGGLNKPPQELRAFQKTSLLTPGASETLTFILTPRDLASWDPVVADWVAAEGTYELRVGTSSRDTPARASFELPRAISAGAGSMRRPR